MKKIVSIIFALGVSSALMGQNLNPTVSVTSNFQGKMGNFEKGMPSMAVPDSLLEFDHKFDYTVFDSPFQGAYEFNPYTINVVPEPSRQEVRRFFLNAGAGYSFRPELDLVWSPRLGAKNFKLNLYDDFNGYAGYYRYSLEDGKYAGAEAVNRLGVQASYAFRGMDVVFDGGYGVQATDFRQNELEKMGDGAALLQTLDAKLNVKSRVPGAFGGSVSYKHGWLDQFAEGNAVLLEDRVAASAFGRIPLAAGSSVRIAADLGLAFSGLPADSADVMRKAGGNLLLTAAYMRSLGRGSLSAGVKAGKDFSIESFGNAGWGIYPVLNASYRILPGAITAFAEASGGSRIFTYQDFYTLNRFFHPPFATPVYFFSKDLLVSDLGFSGVILKNLSYRVSAGYDIKDDGVVQYAGKLEDGWTRKVVFIDYSTLHSSVTAKWQGRTFSVDGKLLYQRFAPKEADGALLGPSPLVCTTGMTYVWNGRIKASATAEWDAARTNGDGYEVPSFLDLGAKFSYAYSRKLELWMKGANLLDQKILRSCFWAEPGLSVTLGVTMAI